jgi:hypothetical protein
MRRSWYLLVVGIGLLAGLCFTNGCRREVPESELGRVLEHVPEVPGLDEPYKLKYIPRRPETTKMGLPPTAATKTSEATKTPEAKQAPEVKKSPEPSPPPNKEPAAKK